jgi:hypothetical protein
MACSCYKDGWLKERKEVTGRQTRRKVENRET